MSITKRLFGSAGDENAHEPRINFNRDTLFHILSSHRRRMLIHIFRELEPGEEVSVGDLAVELASREVGKPADEMEEEGTHRFWVTIYQTHLPKLDEYGVVTFDKENSVATRGDRLNEVVGFLEYTDPVIQEPATEGPDAKPV